MNPVVRLFNQGAKMAETQFQRIIDLSRLNGKGWLLLLSSIVSMFACIIFVGMQPGSYGSYSSDRSGRKFLGVLFAMMAFGGFILIAVGLRKIGVSIWKDGMDPYDEPDTISYSKDSSQVAFGEEARAAVATQVGDVDGDLLEAASDATADLGLPVDPTDLL